MPVRLKIALAVDDHNWLERVYLDWLRELSAVAKAAALANEQLVKDQLADWLGDRSIDLFVLQRDDERVGFACVEKALGPRYRLREFYVAPHVRRLGVGRHAAALLFDRYEGQWQLEVLQSDRSAQRFWSTVIVAYTNGQRREERADGHVRYVFPSRSAK